MRTRQSYNDAEVEDDEQKEFIMGGELYLLPTTGRRNISRTAELIHGVRVVNIERIAT